MAHFKNFRYNQKLFLICQSNSFWAFPLLYLIFFVFSPNESRIQKHNLKHIGSNDSDIPLTILYVMDTF